MQSNLSKYISSGVSGKVQQLSAEYIGCSLPENLTTTFPIPFTETQHSYSMCDVLISEPLRFVSEITQKLVHYHTSQFAILLLLGIAVQRMRKPIGSRTK